MEFHFLKCRDKRRVGKEGARAAFESLTVESIESAFNIIMTESDFHIVADIDSFQSGQDVDAIQINLNVSGTTDGSRPLIGHADMRWGDNLIQGQSFVDEYLVPLAQSAPLAGRVREGVRVLHIGRGGARKDTLIGDSSRANHPFVILAEDDVGQEPLTRIRAMRGGELISIRQFETYRQAWELRMTDFLYPSDSERGTEIDEEYGYYEELF